MENRRSTVCVIGGAGYLGSWLVRKLLLNGHVVHATLRNLADGSKAGLLTSLEGAGERLRLFEADLYDAGTFEAAIQGCEFVFLVATPLLHNSGSPYKDTTEASLAAARTILGACRRSSTVKRVIYTGSVMSTSPWKDDDSGFKNSIDESCWTPLHFSNPYLGDFERAYVRSKTLTERELLRVSEEGEDEHGRKLEVVSLACGLVGGDAILPYVPVSMAVIVSPLSGEKTAHRMLKLLQTMLGCVPLLHVDDVCEAHVFCMERASISGRFLCAGDYPAMKEIVGHYEREYPEAVVNKEVEGGGESVIPCRSTKLIDLGFKFKYDMQQILDGSVETVIRLGFPLSSGSSTISNCLN
ncbi:Dihydroflavonol-4-reductase [Apostasia shenzhenica]|uniref:Dihydroflavonol-4-reductase n=1 Tax=Apostasia shenzhenica TaxID=1088818 RepID=A0A2I0AEW6_9ASPA|nr:Dihydroflavonol-4-reductase [Apostasia shenzhenica]